MSRSNIVYIEGKGQGAGCIVSAMSNDFDYVITAKHLVTDTSTVKITGKWLVEGVILETNLERFNDELYFHNNSEVDAAILFVKKGYLKEPTILDSLLIEDSYKLCGYPKTREDESDQYKQSDIKIENEKPHGYREAEIKGTISYTKDEVEGFSGGGIFNYSQCPPRLVAVQSKMSASDNAEIHGRIDIMPISLFEEIITDNDLAPILPSDLLSFDSFKDYIFSFPDCFVEDHIRYTRKVLRSYTEQIIESNLTPIGIKKELGNLLLIKGEDKQVLNDKSIWIAWLEFLIICFIVYEGEKSIKDIFNDKRLLHTSSKNPWTKDIQRILESDFKGLNQNGHVIISSEGHSRQSVIEGQVLKDISRGSVEWDFIIDEGIEHPLLAFRFILLSAFSYECIENKSSEYENFTFENKGDLITKLKEEYEQLFNG